MGRVTKSEQEDPLEAGERALVELEKGLSIDPEGLDEALLAQPNSYYRVSSAHDLAISNRDESKKHMEEVVARVELKLREDLLETDAKGKDKKPTEGHIRSEVMLDEVVIAANRAYLRWKFLGDRLSSLLRSFEQRGKSLGKLCDLYVAGYFGEVTGNRHRGDAKERVADTNRAALSDQRSRR